jgi:hypothetical protein
MAWTAALVLSASVAAVALAGCASPQALRQRDAAACASRGLQPGTADFLACLQQPAARRCVSGPIAALHVRPYPDLPPCRDDPV